MRRRFALSFSGTALLLLLVVALVHVASSASCNAGGSARVKETEIDGAVETIEWIRATGSANPTTEAIYVITTAGSLYRSDNEGLTWSGQVAKLGPVKALALTNDTNKQWFYNPTTGQLWNTANQGVTYQAVATNRHFSFVQAHPTLPNTALALITESNGNKNLYVTTNFGASWTLKKENVEQASWGQAGEGDVPEGNMLALVRTGDTNTFVSTQDYFTTENYRLGRALVFLYYKKVIFIVTRNANASKGMELWSSVDGGNIYTRAIFPRAAAERRYTILDVTEHAAFVNVEVAQDAPYGTTYGSDGFDREFSEILKYNKRAGGRVDFRRIQGLEGIYVANRFPTADATLAQTVISYSKGSMWQTVKAPEKDMDGRPISCDSDDGCSLHLLGRTDSTRDNYLYSNENAVGMMIANGNVGQGVVSNDAQQTGTYLSRDAGQSWIQIGKGSHTFEIANHGAITLFAEDSKNTTDLKYSWTQGLTQRSCSFTERPMHVTDIATEPDNKARTFIMYGTRAGKGVLVHVDFSSAVRECVSDDFELWSPLGDRCVMGQHYTYQRRKQDRECVVNREHQRVVDVHTCACVEEDYECDFCYAPVGSKAGARRCQKVCDDFDPSKEPTECISTWYETRGYRLVPGTRCDRNSDVSKKLEPIEHTCSAIPDNGSGGSGGGKASLGGGAVFGIILVIMFILVAGLVVAAVILMMINQQFREMAARFMPQRLMELTEGGLSVGSRFHSTTTSSSSSEARPRSSAGYAKVGTSSGSLLDGVDNNEDARDGEEEEEEEEEGSFTSSSSGSRSGNSGEDDFNPRV